jgi:hypothetical protein
MQVEVVVAGVCVLGKGLVANRINGSGKRLLCQQLVGGRAKAYIITTALFLEMSDTIQSLDSICIY